MCWAKTSGQRNKCPHSHVTFLVIYSLSCQVQCDLSCLFLCKDIDDILQCKLTSYLLLPKVLQISRISNQVPPWFSDVLFSFLWYILLPQVMCPSSPISLSPCHYYIIAGKKKTKYSFYIWLMWFHIIFVPEKQGSSPWSVILTFSMNRGIAY